MRDIHRWRLATRTLELGRRTLIMGVLNVTPDSFSDGGRFLEPALAVEQAHRMWQDGANIIDIGGESTRPGVKVSQQAALSAAEEMRRVLPVIEQVKRALPDAILSIDTYKAEVARQAIAAGAEIVNDVSALAWDLEMADAIAEAGCGVVLMHTRGTPEEWRSLPSLGPQMVDLVCRELSHRAAAAEQAGIAHDRIVLDPGFGFGKNFDDNYPLLAHLDELHRLGYPLLAATSRKSFIGRTVSRGSDPAPPEARLHGTMATVTAAILKGAHIVRVHDVAAARETAAVADAILNAE